MSSGIPTAKAALSLRLDDVVGYVRVIERLIKNEEESRIDWSRDAALMREIREKVESWREELA